jgi:hypothetical protein
MNSGLLIGIPVAIGGALGALAGYLSGQPGIYDEYMRNYGMAGAMAGFVVGALLVRRAQARAKRR